MTFWLFIRRSLRFHARNHFGVVLGAAIGSAALIGALVVGDSVRGSLRERALGRLDGIEYALSTQDRFFLQDLTDRIQPNNGSLNFQLGKASVNINPATLSTSVLKVNGVAARQDGRARVNQVNVLGIDLQKWRSLSSLRVLPAPKGFAPRDTGEALDLSLARAGLTQAKRDLWMAGETILLNKVLATQLGVNEADDIILRIHKPSQLAQDAVISPRDETSVALRLKVGPLLPPELLGDFSLAASQTPPPNAFLPLKFLAQKLELEDRANLALIGPVPVWRRFTWWETQKLGAMDWLSRNTPWRRRNATRDARTAMLGMLLGLQSPAPTEAALPVLATRLENNWSLADAQLSVHMINQPANLTGGSYVPPVVELRSARIFLEPSVVSAALKPRTRLLNTHRGSANDTTNDLASSAFATNGTGVLTYLANLISKEGQGAPYSMVTAAGRPFLPGDIKDDEILINEWLAEDLQAKIGDPIDICYYIVDSASRLTERTNRFKVRGIVPLKGIYADRTLMPDFPGVAKAESTHDWDTGFPLTYKIRDKDEAYWKQYRGTPKAFITLAAGQAMWVSRFGSLTAIRYDIPTNCFPEAARDLASKNLLANLNPAELGFHFEPVRQQALRSADQSQDFGQLFIGFSIFLVVAALLLMALLFQFSIEQRRAEIGTLLALGLRPRQVRRLLLGEAMVLALLGGLLGAGAGLGYAKAMLRALTTVWRSAIGTSVLHFYAAPTTLLAGFGASTLVAILVIWLTMRKQARLPARVLLSGETNPGKLATGRVARWVGWVSSFAGLAIIAYSIARGQTTDAEAFFEAGSFLLIGGLAWAATWLSALQGAAPAREMRVALLGIRACARRRKRSLSTIALLASGCFVIVSIGVFRLDANQQAHSRSSGTGGFALIGRATLPVVQDLNSESGREFFGLNPKDLANVSVVPFRVRDGDEASCLNLNRAQKPRLLGVKPGLLTGRFTFSEAAKGFEPRQGWALLQNSATTAMPTGSDEIPAIGDANSIQWALGKSVGDRLDYTDERGRTFKLRLVASVANSILQGNLLIDETEFIKRFPSESGYRYFLIDAPPAASPAVSALFSRALQDRGLELLPAVDRLNAFNAVQNTYLGTFQILGGLGLLLGSAGLGVVVLRNVLERRGELALLSAVGFRKRALQWMVLAEHGLLLGIGLGLGVIAAAVAVLPAMLSPARQLPYGSLSLTLGAVILNGIIWTWLATRVALRGNLLAALRNE